MPSQAVGFAEILVGGILATAGIGGHSIREVIAGQGGSIKPINGGAVASASPPGASPRTPGGVGVGGRGAVNPLPGWKRSRIDQGVDFWGGRKIVAPEGGTIVKTGAPGWPGGGGVLLHTISGDYVYFYEQLSPLVHAGEQVAAGQQIASGTPGGSIEVGLADAAGVPLAHSEYTEGKVTRWGKAFAHMLNLWGAPR